MAELTKIEKFALQMISLYYSMDSMSPQALYTEFRKIVSEYVK